MGPRVSRSLLALVIALVLALVGAVGARAGENLGPAQGNALKARSEDLMRVVGRPADKVGAIEELGRDDSARAAKVLVRWCLDSERRQSTELLEEHRRRDEEFRKLEKLLLKAYEKMPPTQAEHLKSWQTARDLHLTALANHTAETQVQGAITAALQTVSDGAALAFLSGEGMKSVRGAKHGGVAFIAVVKSLLGSRTEADAESVLEWSRAPDSPEVRVLALEWIGENRPVGGGAAALRALADPRVRARRAAVAALAKIDDPDAVKPLIDALAGATGLLGDEIDAALHGFTGQTFDGDARIWQQWWKDHGAEWLARANAERYAAEERRGGGGTSFYGIETRSERIVFVLDRSGSMTQAARDKARPRGPVTGGGAKADEPVPGDTRIEVAKNQLVRSIDRLVPSVAFNVVAFSSDVQAWKAPPGLVLAKPAERESAKKWFASLDAQGSTQLFTALHKALEYASAAAAGGADTIYLLSDGSPTTPDGKVLPDEEVERLLEDFLEANRARRCVVHTIGVGPEHNRSLMERLARATGGKYVSVGDD